MYFDSELRNFKRLIIDNFISECKFYNFAITKIQFNSNEIKPNLKIEIQHYKHNLKIINLKFEDIILHTVTNESNTWLFETNYFFNYSFLSISEGYINKKIDWDFTYENPKFTFTITCQNFVIYVFTQNPPKITVK